MYLVKGIYRDCFQEVSIQVSWKGIYRDCVQEVSTNVYCKEYLQG